MPEKGFAHLHLHSQYSLLDGAIEFSRLFDKCRENGMDSIACTDHGNMFGALDFYTRALAAGIKPIMGFEAYVAPGSRFDKQKKSISDASYHLLLLAENNTGYHNLMKLATVGFTEGFYYRPRIDKEILAELNEGLICSTACLGGEVPSLLVNGDENKAKKVVEDYLRIFGEDRFYIEIQTHENDDTNARPALIDLANKMGLAMIATNDAHFLNEDDYQAHNCLTCIGTNKHVDDPARMIYPRDLYVKTPAEMRQTFSDIPQACDNTMLIAERCNVEIDLKTRHAPLYNPEDGSTAEEFLTKLTYAEAKKKYGQITDVVKSRIDRELDVIQSKGFSSYFLIVWDFCKWAHLQQIPVGARGSGVGTIVGYCLGLCNVDPIRYGLLFERFMDPERDEMPDIDIDICQVARPRLLDYVREKYGYVAQIITMGTMKAKAAIRDICRVMDVPLSEADRLAKMIPEVVGMTLDKALAAEPDFKEAYENEPDAKRVIDICKKIEGLCRHSSTHACGVVIAQEPLENFVPLYKPAGTEDLVTQFEGPFVEKAGLLKMDFLGLKTLSVLKRTRELVKELHGQDIDIEAVDLTDPKVFEIFARGKTKGVFQFESGGMQDLLMKMKPDRIEDLIAANALYRPGPMTLIPDYIARKHGEKWKVPHQIMRDVLEETYGIMIYQEQVMQISNLLGDIRLREAYTMIKAISKKKQKVIAKSKKDFVTGSIKKGLTKAQAEEIFELIERFAGYGFNKSHSTRYAMIAYQTAYFKAYWPCEFMAALITYEDTTEKIVDYIGECKVMGLTVLPPDINESGVDFTPSESDGKPVIRFGLAAVKGVGAKAVEQIIEARKTVGKFKSLFHFCETVDMRAANKQTCESLIKAGAFDRLGGNRAQMMAGLESAMQGGNQLQDDKLSGQMNFLGQMETDDYEKDHEQLPTIDPWPEPVMLAFEKDVLGFYVTANPLSRHAETINAYSTHNTAKVVGLGQEASVIIGGMVTKPKIRIIRNGRNAGSKMAVFVLEDLQGVAEVVLFSETLNKYQELVKDDAIVFVKGTVDTKREKPNIFAEQLIAVEEVTDVLAARVHINLDGTEVNDEKISAIKNLCAAHRGRSRFNLVVKTEKGTVWAEANKKYSVNPVPQFMKEMKQLVGKENVRLTS